jgi:hypothetical protein
MGRPQRAGGVRNEDPSSRRPLGRPRIPRTRLGSFVLSLFPAFVTSVPECRADGRRAFTLAHAASRHLLEGRAGDPVVPPHGLGRG